MRTMLTERNLIKMLWAALAILGIVISLVFVKPHYSDPQTYESQIQSIDRKIDTVMKLTAGSTALSALISALPDDMATPIAEKMADISGYFLIVLCALYLEKYLLTVIGFVIGGYLLPAVFALAALGLFWKKEMLRPIAMKLAVFTLVLGMAVPTSIRISDLVYQTYESSISSTIEAADQSLEEASGDVENVEQESSSGNIFSSTINWISSAPEQIEKFKSQISRYFQAFAVMIVTSCLIPVLVLLLMIWLARIIIEDLGIRLPERKRGRHRGGEL